MLAQGSADRRANDFAPRAAAPAARDRVERRGVSRLPLFTMAAENALLNTAMRIVKGGATSVLRIPSGQTCSDVRVFSPTEAKMAFKMTAVRPIFRAHISRARPEARTPFAGG